MQHGYTIMILDTMYTYIYINKSMHISTVYEHDNAPSVLFLLLLLVSGTHCHLQWGGAINADGTRGQLKTHLVSNNYPTKTCQKVSIVQPQYTKNNQVPNQNIPKYRKHHKSKFQNSFSPVVSLPFQNLCPKHLFCFS